MHHTNKKTDVAFQYVGRALRRYARIRNELTKGLRQADTLLGDLLYDALTDSEKDDITRSCYESTTHLLGTGSQTLFDWERTWLKQDLPPPPARILVTGAGWGREAFELCRMGYEVVAFEPAITDAALSSQPKELSLSFIRADFEDFVQAQLGGPWNALSKVCSTQFDAVLLGWGSLTHVLSPSKRTKVFEAASAAAPKGPILGSVWMRDSNSDKRIHAVRMLAQEVSRLIGRVRGVEPSEPQDFAFSTSFGFGVYLTEAELDAHRLVVNRSLSFYRQPYAHFSLQPCAIDE